MGINFIVGPRSLMYWREKKKIEKTFSKNLFKFIVVTIIIMWKIKPAII